MAKQRYLVTAEQGTRERTVNLTGQGNLTLSEAREVAKDIVESEGLGTRAFVWRSLDSDPNDADFGLDPVTWYGELAEAL